MFLEGVFQELKCVGFVELPIRDRGIFSFAKIEGNMQYIIIMINASDELSNDSLRMSDIIFQIKSAIPRDINCQQRYLNILITNYPDELKSLCSDDIDTTWIVERQSSKIIVFENQDANFEGVYKAIEKGLLEPVEPVKPKKKIKHVCTCGIILINFIVFLFTDVFLSPEKARLLYDVGGLYWPDVVERGEIWRLFTHMFLHKDINHFANNMFMLYFTGIYLEEYLGKIRFLIIYNASGILAGLTSMVYNMLIYLVANSYGASGAVFGVTGALIVMYIKDKDKFTAMSGVVLAIFIGLTIISNFSDVKVDNMAHVGGLIFGMVLCWILTLGKKFNFQN